MKSKNIYTLFIIIGLVFCGLFMPTSCCAKNKKEKKNYMPMQKSEVILKKAVGDSIAEIILKAHQVEISSDSSTAIKLNADERVILRYLIADSCNFSSDTKVYGEFVPYLCIRFKRYKKVIIIFYDFRLNKWMMKGANDKLLCMYDLKTTAILRFASLALPNDKYINDFYKEQLK